MVKKSSPKTSKKKRWKSVALFIATLFFIELCLHLLALVPTDNQMINTLKTYTSYEFRHNNFYWKKRFLSLYDQQSEKTIPISQREYKVDPELGWVPRENLQFTNDLNQTYTTNSLGFRSLREFVVDDDEHFTVLIVGDSFTYGSEAHDMNIWPTILQQFNTKIQVLNMAVGGYGTDQMYLMLKKYIGHFKPDLVIAAFINDNLYRSALSFRDYQKPEFEIEDGALVLTNTPVPDIDAVVKRVRTEARLKNLITHVKLINLLRTYIDLMREAARERAMYALNDLIFSEMEGLCKTHQAEFLLLYLPKSRELRHPGFKDYGETYFEHYVERTNIHSLNPRPLFLASGDRYPSGHYKRPAATLIARAVYEKLKPFPSFPMAH